MAATQAWYDARLLSKYEARNGCWIFTGCLDGDGYGIIQQNGKAKKAHRKMYELLVGPIPEGHDVHHTCENRACGWPGHLAPKPKDEHGREHNPGKESCVKGHALTPDNVKIKVSRGKPYRRCRTCIRDLALAKYYSARNRAGGQ